VLCRRRRMRVRASQVVESIEADPLAANTNTGCSMTVLIVEDNAGIRRFPRRTFAGSVTEIWNAVTVPRLCHFTSSTVRMSC
jgi:hypothetical protein